MEDWSPKAIRRHILQALYDTYMRDPMYLTTPTDLYALGHTRESLLLNIHYLCDRNLAELVHGPIPPYFTTARITADGIDLVERPFEFGRRFPPDPGTNSPELAELPGLMERLVEEADFCSLNGEARQTLQRDIGYLREEIARPEAHWRGAVIATVLKWIEDAAAGAETGLPSLERVRDLLKGRIAEG